MEEYKEKDPIDHVHDMLVKTFKLSEKEIEEIHQRVQLEVDESVQFAEDSPWPDDDELLKDVYVQQDYPFITD